MKLERTSGTAAALTLLGALTGAITACDLDNLSGAGNAVQPSDWEDCPERLDGTWTFGRAPYGCELALVGDAETVRAAFAEYIFDDHEPRSDERQRYMTALHEYLNEQARTYLLERREADEQELDAWRRAVFSTAHQESFWTHYRKTTPENARMLTMLRGDLGHGHGLMQIDDRWHTQAIEAGVGWELPENLLYALDIYYREWQRAPDAHCVDMPDNYQARARSAYSAYNGGPEQLCRWTDPDDPWAQNDEGFHEKYLYQQWDNHVVD